MFAQPWMRHLSAAPSPRLMLVLAVMPLVLLFAYWIGGEVWLTILGVITAVSLLFLRLLLPRPQRVFRDSTTGLMLREGFDAVMQDVFDQTRTGELKSACILVEIDDADELLARHGQAAIDHITQTTADRMTGALRLADAAARLGDLRFAICLGPMRHFDLEAAIQIAGRLQSIVEEPIYVDGLTIYVSCSIGFCLRSRAPEGNWGAWCDAARLAMSEARQNGPSAIRAYTQDMQSRYDVKTVLRNDVAHALDRGEFQAWFQPQIDTDTGRVSGFEALARWPHPVRGPIPPDEFLPVMEAQGLMPRLTSTVLRQSLQALVNWDQAKLAVPKVSINLSQQDLDDPHLADMIAWELDRFDLPADRLCVEILETVVAHAPGDTTVRNLHRLHDLGCFIDLDDYGTGHASIAAIRRFPINRIKIDRSFVIKADRDADQQRLISALLTMAERLDLDTLAEGVETAGEHALLAQLGCGYVQGFGIARPMPVDETCDWMKRHHAKIATPPQIKRRTG